LLQNKNRNGQKRALSQTIMAFKKSIPILMAVLMLLALAEALIPKEVYRLIFTGNELLDPFVGAVAGSIAGGNPITSYILGGELRQQGVSLLAVTAFLVAWVTVGILQLPAEALMLGRRFAVIRNGVSFVLSIVIAVLTVFILGMA
jgi:uncharacterized membrane protein YraQ (UPF0718 family)